MAPLPCPRLPRFHPPPPKGQEFPTLIRQPRVLPANRCPGAREERPEQLWERATGPRPPRPAHSGLRDFHLQEDGVDTFFLSPHKLGATVRVGDG